MQHQHDGTQIPAAAHLRYKRKHHWDTATKPRELWTVEVGNCNFLISNANGAKRGEKGATEVELTILSENHSFQNHTCQHQQTTGTIIRAQTLTQKGFPWVTTLKFHSEQLECQWEMCIKILLDQADWAVLQDKMSFFFFLHSFFLQHHFYAQLAELHLTHQCIAEHPFLSSFCSVPFMPSRNVQAQLSKKPLSFPQPRGRNNLPVFPQKELILLGPLQYDTDFFTVFTGLG